MRYNQTWVDKTQELYKETLIELQELDRQLKPLRLRREILKVAIADLENKWY